MAHKSKILIIGGTGYIGKYIVEESAKAGHPTFALVRENTASNPEKSKLIESFKSSGVTLLNGDIYHRESLVKAIKQVDVVISAVGTQQIADQRFLPSEFGSAVDRAKAVDPFKHHLGVKASIRRSIEAEGIPYTYLLSNGFAGYFLPNFGIARTGGTGSFTAPPRDKVEIIGDGNTKVIFSKEEDIATYTIKAVDDPRTLNKVLHIRPPANILSFNEIVSLWEKKIGKTLEKTYLLEDQLLKKIQESPRPLNLRLSIKHATFVKGNLTNSEVKTSFGVEASELYPEVKYTTTDEYLDHKILIIGGTGYIGKYIVEESAKAGHPTFALVRENAASNPEKSKLIESFHSSGVTLLHGDIYHHESLVKAIKQVDVVISALGSPEQIADQRFLPSEFGGDVDRIHAVEPIEHHFWAKASIRRSIEAEGVPYTTLFPMAFLVIFSKEEDIATSTIKAVDDPRTLNKVLHVRPPANILSFNEIVSLWEKKIGKTLEKTYLLEDQLLKKIQECSNPLNLLLLLSIAHSTFVKGNLRDFEIKASNGVEASELYPEVKYTTVDEYLHQFV
ncbi:isoflavone reductase-like protein [Quercus suber]|uniref:Isoflavone reductase-like protein n=1 Tax=Quercus suber TaxID=58331 RepID=A0AAW0JJ77_QUESU